MTNIPVLQKLVNCYKCQHHHQIELQEVSSVDLYIAIYFEILFASSH